MQRADPIFSIIDFLIVVALLMILSPLFVPRIVASFSKAKGASASHPAANVHRAR